MQNTETFQTLQGLRTQPHKSPAKCTALLWIVTQFFLFMYGITAMIDAAQENNLGMGFQAVWMMLLGIGLGVFGSLVLCRPMRFQTRNSYGVFIGSTIMLCQWMLCQAAYAGGTDFNKLIGGCDGATDALGQYQDNYNKRQTCIANCTVQYPQDANVATKTADEIAEMSTAQISSWLGWDKTCALAMTRRAVVAFCVFLFLFYLIVAVRPPSDEEFEKSGSVLSTTRLY